MYFDKPFLSFDDQVNLLISRGLKVPDREHAIELLKELSYYTLVNGYKDIIQNENRFEDNYSMEDLREIHMAAQSIHSVLLKFILIIENSFKTTLTYLIGEKYGVWTDLNDQTSSNQADYLNLNNYSTSSRYTTVRNKKLREFKGKLREDNHYKIRSDALRHYKNNHNHIPPWILATELTFADVIKWYSFLKPTDKEAICSTLLSNQCITIEDKKHFFAEALEILRKFRNSTAHNGKKEWNFPISLFTRQVLQNLYADRFNCQVTLDQVDGLSGVILIVYFLLMTKETKEDFLKDLKHLESSIQQKLSNGMLLNDVFGNPLTVIFN